MGQNNSVMKTLQSNPTAEMTAEAQVFQTATSRAIADSPVQKSAEPRVVEPEEHMSSSSEEKARPLYLILVNCTRNTLEKLELATEAGGTLSFARYWTAFMRASYVYAGDALHCGLERELTDAAVEQGDAPRMRNVFARWLAKMEKMDLDAILSKCSNDWTFDVSVLEWLNENLTAEEDTKLYNQQKKKLRYYLALTEL